MATLSDSLVSSAARKLRIRKRPDLSARRQHYLGESYWVVKDPVGLNYYRFQEEEFAILNMLDGDTSLDEIKERFEAQFPPQKITLEELQQFLGTLHRSGLVIASVPEQGQQLHKRSGDRKRKELVNTFSNILAIRFKGIDPERILTALYPWTRWLFHPVTLWLCVLAWAGALLLIMVHFQVFRSKLPEFYQFFTPTNALWMAGVLAVTKIFHEFGHGLACKHFRGECHEMGVMILVLTPCLYCNVSDSWMLPNKWHRAGIGAAGIFVELTLASLATFVWWFSEPGVVNHTALNIMFVCSVSTILFNGNPLLRYDGYYVLADILEIPNLRQKATQILSRTAGKWFMGLEPPDDPFLPQRNKWLFISYSIAAAIYRWVVVLSILLFLNEVFKPYRLQIIGQAIAIGSIYGLAVHPLYQLGKFFYVPGRWNQVKKPRMYATLAGLGLIAAFVLFVPLPYHVICTLEVQPEDAVPVYVDVPGRLDEVLVKQGQRVSEGTVLAQLSNIDLELELAKLRELRDQYAVRVQSLRRRQFNDSEAAQELPTVMETLETIESQLAEKKEEARRLQLVAPGDGVVIPPPWREAKKDRQGALPSWSATPLERQNLKAFLQESDLFCLIGDPEKMEAVLIVDQADIDFVHPGQKVRIKLDELPHRTFGGTIEEIANVELEAASRRLSGKAGGDLPTMTDPETGIERPISTSYQARVPLSNDDGLLRTGLRGRAKVYMGPEHWQTIGQRFWRFVSRTFNFRL